MKDVCTEVSCEFFQGYKWCKAPSCPRKKSATTTTNAGKIENCGTKHGRWIEVSDGSGYVGEPCEACSVCGMQTDYPSNYCPKCGARMDEVEE